MASADSFDVVVIGAGTAGLVTAAGVAGLGGRAALIERDRLGGDCLWTGCVPSKALIASARLAHDLARGPEFGLPALSPRIDTGAVLESVRAARAVIQPHDDPERFRAMGVEVVEGEARFVSGRKVLVGERRLGGRRFVIATGSRPAIPPIPGLEEAGYFTHVEAFDRAALPNSLAVIGGGAIGVELAQAFARLGVEVTVVEMLDRLLAREEPELVERLEAVLREEGVRVLTGRRVERVERANGRRRLHLARDPYEGSGSAGDRAAGADSAAGGRGGSHPARDPGAVVEADEILVATGRRANTEGLGLEAAGVDTDRGWVIVDDRLRTTARHILAAGDVTGGHLFTHVADHEARVAVQNALFPIRARIRYDTVPWCTYTDPELARVGLREEEARERHGDAVGTHVYDLSGLDRAVTERAARGVVKVVTGRGGKILGGHVLARDAGTMIAEIALAMDRGIGLGALSTLVHAYPTMSEGVRRAADAYRRSLLTGWRKRALDLALRLGRSFPA